MDDGFVPLVFDDVELVLDEALAKMTERFFTGHRVRTSSTTLTNAARYGTDVAVTLNLSCDSDLATTLSNVESTRVVRATVDWMG